ncbi:MAG: tripartite tricarboxylate transporter substrate binding protein [Ideonella sp.]
MTQKTHLRRALCLAIAASLGGMFSLNAHAQAANWPTQVVKVVVGFPAGSSPDIVARLVTEPLSKVLGQPVIVENKPGAGGNIGVDTVARADDNHTFGFTTNGPLTTSPVLYRKLPYDVEKDLRLLSLAATSTQVLVVSNGLSVKTLPELLAYSKANKGALSYGSVGVGSGSHLTGELFAAQTGIDMLHVPYQGFGQVTSAIVGGQIQVAFMAPSGALAQAKAGKLQVLAVTSAKASASVPGVPTVAEAANIPNFKAELWIGAIAPKSMPDAIQTRLTTEINKILHSPDVQTKLAALGWEAVGSTPAEMRDRIVADTKLWGDVIKRANVKVE